MDALHTQTDTATLITEAGGDYVFTVKANTPTLHRRHTHDDSEGAAYHPHRQGRCRA